MRALEIWDLEIGRFLHLKAEIIDLKLDNPMRQATRQSMERDSDDFGTAVVASGKNGHRRRDTALTPVQFKVYDFGFEMQESSDFEIPDFRIPDFKFPILQTLAKRSLPYATVTSLVR